MLICSFNICKKFYSCLQKEKFQIYSAYCQNKMAAEQLIEKVGVRNKFFLVSFCVEGSEFMFIILCGVYNYYNCTYYTIVTHLIGSYCKIFIKGVARGKYFTNMTQSNVLLLFYYILSHPRLIWNFRDI